MYNLSGNYTSGLWNAVVDKMLEKIKIEFAINFVIEIDFEIHFAINFVIEIHFAIEN